MGEHSKIIGLSAIAVSAFAFAFLIQSPTSSVELVAAPTTTVFQGATRVSSILRATGAPEAEPADEAPKAEEPAADPAEPAWRQPLIESLRRFREDNLQKQAEQPQTGTASGFTAMAVAAAAAVAGLVLARRPRQAAIDPMDLYAPQYNTYAMLSAAGASEAEPAAPVPAVKAVVKQETSYAKIIENIEKKYMKPSVPHLEIGDTVVVGVNIKEGEKERVQDYEGVIICMRNGGLHKNITVRATLQNIGVERTFPLHCKQVEYIRVIKQAKVRRAKLFYLRGLSGRAARLKQRFPKKVAKTKAEA